MEEREAQFLQGRETRIASKYSQSTGYDSTYKVLQQSLLQFDSDLDSLQSAPNVTTKQRRDVSDGLERLEGLLHEYSHLCASLDLDLRLADVRRFHKDCTQRFSRLEQVRQQSCPPTKFVFLRYRAAMQGENVKLKEKPKTAVHSHVQLVGNAIHDLCDVCIVEQIDGRIRIEDKDKNAQFLESAERNSSCIILQNLKRCRIEILGQYKALHLKNVRDCQIIVVQPVEGAIHITGCTTMTLTAFCHQLRLHESQELKCHVKVLTGPILENCTKVLFYSSSENDCVRDAKDFNWLRNGVPSPNYCFVDEKYVKDTPATLSLPQGRSTCSSPIDGIPCQRSSATIDKTDEMSDDEL